MLCKVILTEKAQIGMWHSLLSTNRINTNHKPGPACHVGTGWAGKSVIS